MKINITKNKNLLNISFFKIDFQKVKELLILLDIKIVSVFFDKCNKYVFSHLFHPLAGAHLSLLSTYLKLSSTPFGQTTR